MLQPNYYDKNPKLLYGNNLYVVAWDVFSLWPVQVPDGLLVQCKAPAICSEIMADWTEQNTLSFWLSPTIYCIDNEMERED